MRLSLVADREFPDHLVADTEQALRHVGWIGVRRHVRADGHIHMLQLAGHVPPVTVAHDGHDHAGMLADLCRGWAALDVACAVVADAGDPLAAVRLIRLLAPGPAVPGLRADLVERLDRLDRLTDSALAGAVAALTPDTQELVERAGEPRAAVHLAGTLLGLRAV